MIRNIINKLRYHKKNSSDLLWSKQSEFNDNWEKRNKLIASYVDLPGTVVDVGCGMMWLEKYLRHDNLYLPINYIKRDRRTINDVNNNLLPYIKADIAVFSGFIEYFDHIDKFIYSIRQLKLKRIVMSYCTTAVFHDIATRKGLNWINHLSMYELLLIMLIDYNLIHIDCIHKNNIFVFGNK